MPSPEPASPDFWPFSLRLYARAGVAPACLALQDRFGRDVNLVLYLCWVGASGRGRLTAADLDRAESVAGPWRRETVEPLRALRRRIKETPDAGSLYEALKAAELAAEQVAQDRLTALAPAEIRAGADRLGDALANLALYLGANAAGAAAEPLRRALADEIRLGD